MVLAGAVPEIVAKKGAGDVENVFTNLGNKLDAVTPEFSGCKDDTCTNNAVSDIASAIDNQAATLGSLSCGSDNTAVAPFVANVINVSFWEFPGLYPLRSRTVARKSPPISARTRTTVVAAALV